MSVSKPVREGGGDNAAPSSRGTVGTKRDRQTDRRQNLYEAREGKRGQEHDHQRRRPHEIPSERGGIAGQGGFEIFDHGR